MPDEDEILVMRNFAPLERIRVPVPQGGHFGADPELQKMLFVPDMPDPLGQRAGAARRRDVGAHRRRRAARAPRAAGPSR